MSTNTRHHGPELYQDLSVAIFNYIRSSTVDFRATLLMPYLDSPPAARAKHDAQKILLIDMTLREMMKDGIVRDIAKSGVGGTRMLAISPEYPPADLHKLVTYTQYKLQAARYQWIKRVFNTRLVSPPMVETLDELERYLKAQEITIRNTDSQNATSPNPSAVPKAIPPPHRNTPARNLMDRENPARSETQAEAPALAGFKRRRSASGPRDASMVTTSSGPLDPATLPVQTSTHPSHLPNPPPSRASNKSPLNPITLSVDTRRTILPSSSRSIPSPSINSSTDPLTGTRRGSRQAAVDGPAHSSHLPPQRTVTPSLSSARTSTEAPVTAPSQRASPLLNHPPRASSGTPALHSFQQSGFSVFSAAWDPTPTPTSSRPQRSGQSANHPPRTSTASPAPSRVQRPRVETHSQLQKQNRLLSSSTPISTSIAGPDLSRVGNPSNSQPLPSQADGQTGASGGSQRLPPILEFITYGLARFREKFPDDLFEPQWDPTTEEWLIKCSDCTERLYRPNYDSKSTGNFEAHLKSRSHTGRVTARLDKLGKKATLTQDVRAREEKNLPGRQQTSTSYETPSSARHGFPMDRQLNAMTSEERTSFPTERQLAMASRAESESSSKASSAVTRRLSFTGALPEEDEDDEDYVPSPSLVAKLGQVKTKAGQSQPIAKSASEEGRHRSKRLRLDKENDPLGPTVKNDEEFISRVKILELEAQSQAKSHQIRNLDLDKSLEILGSYDRSLADNIEVNRKRIDQLTQSILNFSPEELRTRIAGVELSVQKSSSELLNRRMDALDVTMYNYVEATRKHTSEIEELKRLATIDKKGNAGAPPPDSQAVERLLSKQAEMEQTITQLQTLCTTQSQRLDTTSKTEAEMTKKITEVQRLALRQFDARNDFRKEKAELEERFTRMEKMIMDNSRSSAFKDITDNYSNLIAQVDAGNDVRREKAELEVRLARMEKMIMDNSRNSAFEDTIDNHSNSIAQCESENGHLMERIEALEKERDEQKKLIDALQARIPVAKGSRR